jgi:diacylglycerol O-acyltransferase-2
MALTDQVPLLLPAVGEPITIPKLEHPTQQDIDLYHTMYVEALVKLFDKHKTKFGLLETEVLEVN